MACIAYQRSESIVSCITKRYVLYYRLQRGKVSCCVILLLLDRYLILAQLYRNTGFLLASQIQAYCLNAASYAKRVTVYIQIGQSLDTAAVRWSQIQYISVQLAVFYSGV